jgi:uncharacterized repeat protein (TIGR01451 family)
MRRTDMTPAIVRLFCFLCVVLLSTHVGFPVHADGPIVEVSKDINPDTIYVGSCSGETITANIDLGFELPPTGGGPVDVILVIDRSTTMLQFARIDSAKKAAKAFVDELRDIDMAGLVSFANGVTLDLGLTPMDSLGKIALKEAIDNIDAYGQTNIGDALLIANQEIQDDGRGGDTSAVYILLSDGFPNRPTSVPDAAQYARDAAGAAKSLNVRIETVGLALTVPDTLWMGIHLLEDIADSTGGQYHDSPTPAELHDIFVAIAEEITKITDIVVVDVLQPYIAVVGFPSIVPDTIIVDPVKGTTKLLWTIAELLVGDVWTVNFDVSADSIGTDLPVQVPDSSKIAYTMQGARYEVLIPQDSITVLPCPQPVLAAAKTDSLVGDADGDGLVSPGDTLEYALMIANSGDKEATGVVLLDTIDTNTNIVPSSLVTTHGSIVSGEAAVDTVVEVNINTLMAGDTARIVFRVVVDDPLLAGVDIIGNRGFFSSQELDILPTPIVESPVSGSPDIVVQKDNGATEVTPDQELTYTITVRNDGDRGVTGVVLSDTLDGHVNFVGASDGGTEVVAGVVTWDAFDLAGGGAFVTRTVTVRVVDPLPAGVTEIGNVAVASDDGQNGADANPDNNLNTDTDEVDAAPDIVVEKDDGETRVEPGDELTYTITVRNSGDIGVTGVELSDTLDGHVEFVGASDGGIEVMAGVVTWGAFELAGGGAFVTRTVTVRVADPMPAGVNLIENMAVAFDDGSNGDDPDLDNNRDDDIDEVTGAPEIEVVKTDERDIVSPGDELIYTITVINNGNRGASHIWLYDSLDTHAQYISASDDGIYDGVIVRWPEFDLAGGGASVTRILHVSVVEPWPAENGSLFTNSVFTGDDGANGEDPTPENNSYVDTDTVQANPFIEARKVDIDKNGGALYPGDTLEYVVTIANTGDQNAEGLKFADEKPGHTHGLVVTTWPSEATKSSTADSVIISDIDVVAGESVTIVFRVTVDDTIPADVSEIVNQGEVSNIPDAGDVLTDDPSLPGPDDPTVTPLVASPIIEAYKAVTVLEGGDVEPGDVLEYRVTIVNNGNKGASNLTFSDPIPEHTQYVGGSLTLVQGDGVIEGTDPIHISGLYLQPGVDVIFTFQVVVDDPIDADVDSISNQGLVSGIPDTEFEPTDDPPTEPDDDPTVVSLIAAPVIEATKVDIDLNGDLLVPGDVLRYVIAITNSGNQRAEGLTFLDSRPEYTHGLSVVALPPNAVDDSTPEQVRISGIDVPAGSFVTLSFEVILDAILPPGVMEIENQGMVGNLPEANDEPTDDPSTLRDDDPTVTPIDVRVPCFDHTDGSPETFLLGSALPDQDIYAVWYYNPGGEARIVNISAQWYDPGRVDVSVYTCGPDAPSDGMCEPGAVDLLGDELGQIPAGTFAGTWRWETVEIEDPCILIPPKSCFFVVFRKTSGNDTPRILADDTRARGGGTHSWFYNGETGQWKCYPNWEFMVRVCVTYDFENVLELDRTDVTWMPEYPCEGDPYDVCAIMHNRFFSPITDTIIFAEADWGLFVEPHTIHCEIPVTVEPRSEALVCCECQYMHESEKGNAWSRNILIGYTVPGDLCSDERTTAYFRVCRRTIWPEKPWAEMMAISPIHLPIHNSDPNPYDFNLTVEEEDLPADWACFIGPSPNLIISGHTTVDAYVTIIVGSTPLEKAAVIRVSAVKCNGERAVAEIELMPYTPKYTMQPVEVTDLWWSPRYPCHETPYDVWAEVHNLGTESAYPKISFGLAPWGFFFPVYEDWNGQGEPARYDTVITTGVGGGDEKIVAPYHHRTPFFVYHDQECTYYQGYYRNIVIDYPYVERHCFNVEVLTERYYRDCEAWLWPKHRWPWDPVAIPIPVYNEEPYPDDITIYDVIVPVGWEFSLSKDVFTLEPGAQDTAWLSLVPGGNLPMDPIYWPLGVYVYARKSFCELEWGLLHIKFMPFTGMCIPDYNGTVVEDPPGVVPQFGPGDEVQVNLMMENDYPVSAAQIDVHYDEEVLDLVMDNTTPRVDPTARTAGMQMAAYKMGDGHLRILIDSTPVPHQVIAPSAVELHCEDAGPGGNLSIATVWFEIESDAPVGQCTDVTYGTVVLDGLMDWNDEPKEPLCLKFKDKGQICFGGYIWPVKCDVTLDSSVTLVDLFAILRHIIGKVSLGPPTDIGVPGTPLWAADANGDHLVNIIDLMKCINKAIGLPDPKAVVPDVFANDVVALPGRTVSLPVEVASEADIAGLMLRFGYDAAALSVGQPELTERASGMLLDYGLVDGELVVLVSSLTGEVIEAGAGAVVRVPFEVAEGVEAELAIEMVEPLVFTADEQVHFGEGSVVVLKVEDLIPAEYSLAQNYPNPFNPTTSIAYSLPEAAKVKVEIYNALGQVVAVLMDGNVDAGYHTVEWNADNMSSGVYFYRIQANDFTATKRMVLMK